jgi:hypothetical protein
MAVHVVDYLQDIILFPWMDWMSTGVEEVKSQKGIFQVWHSGPLKFCYHCSNGRVYLLLLNFLLCPSGTADGLIGR